MTNRPAAWEKKIVKTVTSLRRTYESFK